MTAQTRARRRRRSYESPLRERRKTDTRLAILDAVVHVVNAEGIHAFTVPNVARQAGVAARTVYRHFASREALLDGLTEALDARASLRDAREISEDNVRRRWKDMDRDAEAQRACVVASIALQVQPRLRSNVTKTVRRAFRSAYPHVDRAEVESLFAVMRMVVSSRFWHLLRVEGVSSRVGLEGVVQVVRLITEHLARREAAARREG